MAFSKARRLSDFIAADGSIPTGKFASSTITSAHLVDGTVAPADLHTNMDLTGKTVLVANASTGDSDTTAANTAFVQQEIAALVDSSPSALNTLNELAAALGDDANFSTTVTNSIATKLPLAGGTMTGTLAMDAAIDIKSGSAIHGTITTSSNSLTLNARNTGHLIFQSGGNEKMRLNGSDVGIGTGANVDELLHIEKSSGTTLVKTEVASNSVVGFEIQKTGATTSNWRIVDGQTVNGVLEIYDVTDSRSVMAFKGDGNVGIGTSNPATQLQLLKTGESMIRMGYSTTQYGQVGRNSDGTYEFSCYENGGVIKFGTTTSNNSTTERMRINARGALVFNPSTGTEVNNSIVAHTNNYMYMFGNTAGLILQNNTAGDTRIRIEDNNTMRFETSSTQRMYITADGRIGINNNGAAWVDANDKFITNGRGVFRGYGHSPLAIGRYNSGGTAGEAGSMLAFLYGGAGVGSVSITTNSTQYNTTSDIRLKENIQTIVDGSSKIMAMNPVSHTWKDNPTEDAVHGFIAQEMKDIVPESVTGEPEGEEMMQMDYGRITPVIVAGLQDALKEIEKLKERINELENK